MADEPCGSKRVVETQRLELDLKCELAPRHRGSHRAVLIGDVLVMWPNKED